MAAFVSPVTVLESQLRDGTIKKDWRGCVKPTNVATGGYFVVIFIQKICTLRDVVIFRAIAILFRQKYLGLCEIKKMTNQEDYIYLRR